MTFSRIISKEQFFFLARGLYETIQFQNVYKLGWSLKLVFYYCNIYDYEYVYIYKYIFIHVLIYTLFFSVAIQSPQFKYKYLTGDFYTLYATY